MLLFYDFEVFKHDWLVVIYDMQARQKHVIINDRKQLTEFYEKHQKDIWCGYNSHRYDQFILKAILLGMDPKYVNDAIIKDGMNGWQINPTFSKIPFYDYDCGVTPYAGLKTLEGFMGSDIQETDVPFDIDRKLTASEIEQTVKYCTHDVEQTIEVFIRKQADFNSKLTLVKEFELGLSHIGDTSAQITALVLGCEMRPYRGDEFDFKPLPCLQIKKYANVVEWFKYMFDFKSESIYKEKLVVDVAGVPHTFAFGGLHGAPIEPIHEKGALYHVDVNNYYPSLLIAHNLVTRSAHNDNYAKIYKIRKELKEKQLNAKTKAEKNAYKVQQLPYKQLLNSLSGAMKDRFNRAYDPRSNNMMCVNGQLLLLDLIEHLEVIDGFKLIQSNTDGLIVKVPDTDAAFEQLDDICYEWEQRVSTDECSIELALDSLSEIYQKDVNNYLWMDLQGGIGERKGGYVKELNDLDNDLPIVNEAIVNYMAKNIPVESTINACNELIKFQKLVKLSNKYDFVRHNGKEYSYKCYRVFASTNKSDGQILKCKHDGKADKFANTPNNCFIDNSDVKGKIVPHHLDKQYYIDLAKKRLEQFGV